MNILVLNCGSSSLKYQLINMEDESVIAKGLVERIGIDGSILTHKPTGKDKYVVETPMKDHNLAVKLVLDALMDDSRTRCDQVYRRNCCCRSQSTSCR